ncbi:MAG: MarR family transcriptional regulator [Planctomycetota bacterium]
MAYARLTDPSTSQEAAAATEASGRAGTHRALCLSAVRAQPGLTAAEIANAVGLERHEPSRRLPELRERGLVRNGPERQCRIQGTRSITWFPTPENVE